MQLSEMHGTGINISLKSTVYRLLPPAIGYKGVTTL